jgi:hypothetical protein
MIPAISRTDRMVRSPAEGVVAGVGAEPSSPQSSFPSAEARQCVVDSLSAAVDSVLGNADRTAAAATTGAVATGTLTGAVSAAAKAAGGAVGVATQGALAAANAMLESEACAAVGEDAKAAGIGAAQGP